MSLLAVMVIVVGVVSAVFFVLVCGGCRRMRCAFYFSRLSVFVVVSLNLLRRTNCTPH
jgi:hypothetical protein